MYEIENWYHKSTKLRGPLIFYWFNPHSGFYLSGFRLFRILVSIGVEVEVEVGDHLGLGLGLGLGLE